MIWIAWDNDPVHFMHPDLPWRQLSPKRYGHGLSRAAGAPVGLCCPYPMDQSMSSLLPGLSEWLQHQGLPASVLVVLGFVWYEVKASEARQVKRSDELRADMKEGFAQCRADMKEGFAQQRADMKEGFVQCRADNRSLAEKVDRLVESLLTAKQS